LILGGQRPGGPRNEKQAMTGLYWGEARQKCKLKKKKRKKKKEKKEKYSNQGGGGMYGRTRALRPGSSSTRVQ
jgi:hypothetical protein